MRKNSTRSLGVVDAIALTVGSMVGAGIFSILALTVQTAGRWAAAAWVLVVLFSFPMALAFSDLVGVLSQSGGPYVYIRRKARTWLGMWTAWLFLISAGGATAALFSALIGMLGELGIGEAKWLGALILLALALVASTGIHMGAIVQRVLTTATVILLVACIVIGFTHPWHGASTSTSLHAARHGIASVFTATFYAFWTYSGWEAVAVPAGSYRSRRALAMGMIAGSLLVGALYILVALAALVSLPVPQLAGHMNPLVLVGERWHPWMGSWIGWGALVVVAGSILSWLIATTSLIQATARDGLLPLPGWLRNTRREYHPAIPWLLAALLIAISQLPVFTAAVAASSQTALIGYAVVFAVVLADPDPWDGVFTSHRLRRWVALLAFVMTGVLMAFSGWANLWPTLVLCAAGGWLIWLRRHAWSGDEALFR
ncbi:APC family permease [Alicyclobacillus contaminans]|uniref:APC family permease n=1 Tax=Alicyclobacillus contaminans TaxID=392016 RepID=UPI000419839F|nr:APC family permease [Alicyclobacillus contaminans]